MTKKSSSIWGGNFDSSPSVLMEEINASIYFDCKLYKQDIEASKIHAEMLVKQGIILRKEGEEIIRGLMKIESEFDAEEFELSPKLEDIHMNIEHRLTELIGPTAGKLHTARSRNDQVATDFKLYVLDAMKTIRTQLVELRKTLLFIAKENIHTMLPGYTHLQNAQPVSLAHHFCAYNEMFKRDCEKIDALYEIANECPLGAAALAGTSFDIDRFFVAEELGFDRGPTRNSLDTVSDRDFALDFLYINSLISMHLSRLAEEIVLWASKGFNFVILPDSFSTGSSIMPQKRNPDAAELIRGKFGRVLGNLTSLFVTLKALPLAYSKDMQEDKEPVFDSNESLQLCILAMSGMLKDISFNIENMEKASYEGYTNATEIADWLVCQKNMEFRQAHHISGQIVKLASQKNVKLEDLTVEAMQKIEPNIDENILDFINCRNTMNRKTSYGGTAPVQVQDRIDVALQELDI